jgi:hypothetical protein
MSIFKRKNTLKQRVKDLECYLGLAYTDDGYGTLEHIERPYGELVSLQKDVKELKQKGKK